MTIDLIIYHGACRDGFAAAWVAHEKYPEAEFFAAFYGQSPPETSGKAVLMLDFSYPRPIIEVMAKKSSILTVLDHHKTAEADLSGFPWAIFDMERSGAGMAWDYLCPEQPRPWLIDYIEDRDLWRHKLPNSEEVNAYISTLEFHFAAYTTCAYAMKLEMAVQAGVHVKAKTAQYVREVSKNAFLVNFEGAQIPVVNAPQFDISELLDSVSTGHPFALGWWQRSDGIYQYSLRSQGDVDVSQIARKYGGGGHFHAAGFQSAYPLGLERVQ